MRVYRFIDTDHRVQHGTDYDGQSARLLDGDRRVAVRKLLAPVDPRAILCIGLNYRKHAEETGAPIPQRPVLFMKNPAAVCHPGDPIALPASCMDPPQVDYEVELAVVIGKAAKNVALKDALDYVRGYTVGNDISARIWQKTTGGGGQWIRGKSFDTFCPLGPYLVTPDEIPDPQALRVTTRLNGQTMQDGDTADMIFPVAELIHQLSQDMTLLPDTLIMTGTPSGVGVARDPQVFLKPGDKVRVAVEGVVELTSDVTAA